MKKKPTPPRTEDPLEQFRQECRDMLNEALPKHNALSGFQRSWIKQYIENADGECRVESNGNCVTFHWCPVTKAVCKAIDQGDLSKDFNEHALLKWATETGYTLTWSGLNVWDNKKNEALDKAIKDCTQGLSGEETVFQWPPEIVEWVKAETGIEPELNDPAQKNRTDFETALQLLLRERTGYDLKDLEDGLPTSEYVQLARVAARIKGHREQTAAPPGKVETKTQDAARATESRDKKPEDKRGRRPYSVKVHNRDAEIYNALKSGSTYAGLMERYGMKKSEVKRARDRHRKKVAKKRERLE